MRQLIILPGNSSKNKAWGDLMVAHYGGYFDNVYMQSYRHWESGAPLIDFEQEQAVLAAYVARLQAGATVTLFAKSAGSLLALLAIDRSIVAPAFCAFFGIPFDMAAENIFKTSWAAVENFNRPAVAFHNQGDPTAGYAYTASVVTSQMSSVQLITTHESDHWYGDMKTYDTYLLPIVKK